MYKDIKLKLAIGRIWFSFFNVYAFGFRFPYVENPLNQPERTNEAAGALAKACVAVARESGLPVIDLWTKMQQFPGWQKAHLRCLSLSLNYVSDVMSTHHASLSIIALK